MSHWIITDLHPYYLIGSIISIICSLLVLISYYIFPELRKHPSSIVCIRSIFDIIFSCQLISIYIYNYNLPQNCNSLAIIFQLSVYASLCYYFIMAVDLYLSLTNPFVKSQTYNMYYHIFTISTTTATALIIGLSGETDYREGLQICWIKSTGDASSANPYNWALFFGPCLIFLIVSIGILIFTYNRLSVGLPDTFKVRHVVAKNLTGYVVAFAVYWITAGALYIPCLVADIKISNATLDTDKQALFDDHAGVFKLFALVIGLRGLPDAIVWFRNQQINRAFKRYMNGQKAPESHPDINTALRKEVLVYTTRGINESVNQANKMTKPTKLTTDYYPKSLVPATISTESIVKIIVKRDGQESSSDPYAEKVDITLDDLSDDKKYVPFHDYAPQVFRELRRVFGIKDNNYVDSLRGNTEAMCEKYTEGRSTSWFYFSEDSKYIVKTLEESETELLLQILPRYLAHMTDNPDSLIVKFVGLHAITLYNMTKYFVVMQSVFLTSEVIHERYDIKGSWIDRHTPPNSSGKGILKDSDLHKMLLLNKNASNRFLSQVEADSKFLAFHNIMDYSLLLGIHMSRQVSSSASEFMLLSASSSNLLSLGGPINSKEPLAISPVNKSIVSTTVELPHISLSPRVDPSFFQRHNGGLDAQVIEGPGLYFVGIIDILQAYNTGKQLERFAKTIFQCKNGDGISAVPPNQYSKRFINKIKGIVQVCENESDLELYDRDRQVSKLSVKASAVESEEELDDSV